MTVEDLIELLKTMPQTAVVFDNDFRGVEDVRYDLGSVTIEFERDDDDDDYYPDGEDDDVD